MRGLFTIGAVVAALALGAPASAASVFVTAASSTPTVLGTLTAFQSYTYSVTGTASLCATCNNGTSLDFTADGKPAGPMLGAYASFAPNGLDFDPTTGGFGAAGQGYLLGSLVLGLSGGPLVASGFSGTLTPTSNVTLTGFINDTGYGDNPGGTGFTFTYDAVTAPGVPEPATWALMLGGFAAVGMATRRRSRQVVLG